MYNTKIICTYNTSDVFLETDDISETDKDFIRDAIYRQEFLDIFGIEEYEEAEINKGIHFLYEKIKDCEELFELAEKTATNYTCKDPEFGLLILFSFHYMYLTHICVSEYLETNQISLENIQKLRELVFV